MFRLVRLHEHEHEHESIQPQQQQCRWLCAAQQLWLLN